MFVLFSFTMTRSSVPTMMVEDASVTTGAVKRDKVNKMGFTAKNTGYDSPQSGIKVKI